MSAAWLVGRRIASRTAALPRSDTPANPRTYRSRFTRAPANSRSLSPTRSTPTRPPSFTAKAWSLKRSANYGSAHVNEHPLAIESARLSADRRSVTLAIPQLAPTHCMEIAWKLRDATGSKLRGQHSSHDHAWGRAVAESGTGLKPVAGEGGSPTQTSRVASPFHATPQTSASVCRTLCPSAP
jgi:hypothetical protein